MESKLKDFLEEKNNILLVPDPENKLDSLPASLALALVLEKAGKKGLIYFEHKVPEKLAFLNIQRFIKNSAGTNSLSVVIDTSRLPVKKIQPQKSENALKLVLHTENPVESSAGISIESEGASWDGVIVMGSETPAALQSLPGDIPILNIKAEQNSSSVSETLTRALKEGYEPYINEEVATALLTGIIAATQNFQTASLKPQSLFSSAYLIAKRARNEAVVRHLYKTKSLDSVKLWGSVISNFTFHPEKKIGWTFVGRHEGAKKDHIAPLINELKNNFAQANIFVMGVEDGMEKSAVIHASDAGALKTFTEKHKIPVKNSSCMVRLNPAFDIKTATENLVQEIENSL